jgi:hypothetical protein
MGDMCLIWVGMGEGMGGAGDEDGPIPGWNWFVDLSWKGCRV